MYERASEKLISRTKFAVRLVKHFSWIFILLGISVLIGAAGLFYFEGTAIANALLYSAFLLSGFGIVQMPVSMGGKLFIGIFGLYANLFFLASISFICAPIIHRIMHKFHLDGS